MTVTHDGIVGVHVWGVNSMSADHCAGRTYPIRDSLLPRLQPDRIPIDKPSIPDVQGLVVNESSPVGQQRLPDPETCRTRYLGTAFGFSDCLMEDANVCAYALRFGDGHLCRHPDRRKFESDNGNGHGA